MTFTSTGLTYKIIAGPANDGLIKLAYRQALIFTLESIGNYEFKGDIVNGKLKGKARPEGTCRDSVWEDTEGEYFPDRDPLGWMLIFF